MVMRIPEEKEVLNYFDSLSNCSYAVEVATVVMVIVPL